MKRGPWEKKGSKPEGGKYPRRICHECNKLTLMFKLHLVNGNLVCGGCKTNAIINGEKEQ